MRIPPTTVTGYTTTTTTTSPFKTIGMAACRIGTVLAVVLLVALSTPRGSDAITCSTVYGLLSPCLGYLNGMPVSSQCCSGVRTLVSPSSTSQDRRTACSCLKSLANGVSSPVLSRASSLPSQCGASLPYQIGASTDCSRIS